MMAIVLGLFLISYRIALRCSFVHILDGNKLCNDLQFKIPTLALNSAINPLAHAVLSAVNPLVYAILKRDIKTSLKDYCLSVTNTSNDELIRNK